MADRVHLGYLDEGGSVMVATTVADILKHAEKFEQLLSDYYRRVSEETISEGVRLLTDHMSRHRVRLKEALAKLSDEDLSRVTSTPIPYEPQGADGHSLEGVKLPPDATSAEVLDVAIMFDQCLIDLYRQASRQSEHEEVVALFEGLISLEEKDEMELQKIKAIHYF